MSTTTSPVIAPRLEQPREFSSRGAVPAIKSNELLISAAAWMALQGITWSEKASLKRLHTISLSVCSKWQSYRVGEQMSSCQWLGRGKEASGCGQKALE